MTTHTLERRWIIPLALIIGCGFGSGAAGGEESSGIELVPHIAAIEQAADDTIAAREAVTAQLAMEELRYSNKGFGGGSPMVIPAAAFSSKGNNASSNYFSIPSGYYRGNSLSGGCIQAGVYLPQGAVITSIWASLYDNEPAGAITVTLDRASNTQINSSATMASITTASEATDIQSLTDGSIANATVDYPDFTYFVQTCLPSVDTRLYSVRIYFSDDGIFTDGFETGNASVWTDTVN